MLSGKPTRTPGFYGYEEDAGTLIDVERAIAAVLVDCDLGKQRPRLEDAHDAMRHLIAATEALEKKAAALPSEVARAYGLLWQMEIDLRNPNLRLASQARKALLSVLSVDEQKTGITWARVTR